VTEALAFPRSMGTHSRPTRLLRNPTRRIRPQRVPVVERRRLLHALAAGAEVPIVVTPSVPRRFASQLSDAASSPASVSARASLPRPAGELFSFRAVRESARLFMKRAASAGKCAVAWVEY
jgi:hypothetical protein